jgi:competence protein ComEA
MAALLVLVFGSGFTGAALGAGEGKASAKPKTSQAPAAHVKLVNINTATAEELAAGLNGVGLRRAKEIVAYRQKVGRFSVTEQLTDIKGIGKKLLERNRARVVLE